eukprot:COSAG02_NODE_17946_length_969_cov_9.078161_1_plen_74_part_10
MFVWLSGCLPAWIARSLDRCLPACLPACLSVCLPACAVRVFRWLCLVSLCISLYLCFLGHKDSFEICQWFISVL